MRQKQRTLTIEQCKEIRNKINTLTEENIKLRKQKKELTYQNARAITLGIYTDEIENFKNQLTENYKQLKQLRLKNLSPKQNDTRCYQLFKKRKRDLTKEELKQYNRMIQQNYRKNRTKI